MSILTTSKGIAPSDDDLTSDPRVHVVPCVIGGGLTYAPKIRSALRQMVSGYDLVHVHGFQSFVGTEAMRVARSHGVPYVIEPHGALDRYHWSQHRLRKRAYFYGLDRPLVNGASSVIVSSDRERSDAARVLPGVRIDVVPLGVDPQLFQTGARRSHSEALRVLFLGRVTRKKRLDILLDALAQVASRGVNVRLTVAGPVEPDLGFNLGRSISALNIADRVDLVGPVDATRRRELLADSDVFVLMSEDESFGVAVAEAMAAGLAVVTSKNVGLAPEAARAGALKIADMHPRSLEESLVALYLDGPEVRTSLGRVAREYAASSFTWDRAAEIAAAVYKAAS